jgi:hypothetical protein
MKRTATIRSVWGSRIIGASAVLAIVTGAIAAQTRPKATPKPGPAAPQPIAATASGPHDPMALEIGALKGQVAALQQSVDQLEKGMVQLQKSLGYLDYNFKFHSHPLAFEAFPKNQIPPGYLYVVLSTTEKGMASVTRFPGKGRNGASGPGPNQ